MTGNELTHDQRVDVLEQAILRAIQSCDVLAGLGHKERCEVVLDALDIRETDALNDLLKTTRRIAIR